MNLRVRVLGRACAVLVPARGVPPVLLLTYVCCGNRGHQAAKWNYTAECMHCAPNCLYVTFSVMASETGRAAAYAAAFRLRNGVSQLRRTLRMTALNVRKRPAMVTNSFGKIAYHNLRAFRASRSLSVPLRRREDDSTPRRKIVEARAAHAPLV